MTYPSDAVAQTERALLGTVLFDNSVWPQAAELSIHDFSLDTHRRIYGRMAAMFEDQRPVDLITLNSELGANGDAAYLSSLVDHALPENFAAYVRHVRRASRERRYARLQEQLSETVDTEARLSLVEQMQEALTDSGEPENWRSLFHNYDEVINAPTATFAIDGFLQEDGITLIGGLAGHGKTLCMLAMVRALLEGGKLFHHFAVAKKAERVIYLIPEAGLGPFASRLRTFHLEQYVREEKLFCRTLSAQGQLSLSDPRILEAAKGADVFLDTAIRFMTGDENSAAEQRAFADSLFALQRAGARTITGAHHSPKSFGKDSYMTLENVLRGSGDIGAMLATCWGLSQIDADATRIFVQNVKARDFLPCQPFIIQGRPSIDQTGYFELTSPPGFAGNLSDNKPQAGRPQVADKDAKIAEARKMHDEGKGYREIATALGVSVGTVSGWLSKRSKSVQ
jgi:DnaB-like helicase N terminal domain/AAA domain